ncbi:MAG: hypothetical protein NC092_03325 [Butyrivibrio sp.]|nr:hypothetical protein [Muribaculum sp.]MCM1551705.1 hypothetical protein [Butyrivibrio sp.]
MQCRSHRRRLMTMMSFLMIFCMLAVNSVQVMAIGGYETDGMDGSDGYVEVWGSGTVDAEDAKGVMNVSAVMESVPQAVQQGSFRVVDSKGVEFGSFESWTALLSAFKTQGDKKEEYTITVPDGGIVGTSMPAQAGRIHLETAGTEEVLIFAGSTVNMSCALSIGEAWLCVKGSEDAWEYVGTGSGEDKGGTGSGSDKDGTGSDENKGGTGSGSDREFKGTPININTKGKTLTLNGTRNIGKLKGTSAGSLDINGDVEVTGALQTFKAVTVRGSLRVRSTVSAVKTLDITSGAVYLASGKSFTVTNVVGGADGALVYPTGDTMPNVKLGGTVSGIVKLRQEARTNGMTVERYFTAGSRLLTASKAGAEQFAVSGEGRTCYKKGSVLYVGAEVLQLYRGNTLLGTYGQWGELVAQIKNLNQRTESYRVVLLDDFAVDGALTMPSKGKYAAIRLEKGDKEGNVFLKVSKSVKLTADLELGEGVRLQASSVSGAAWQLVMSEHTAVTTSGAFTVANLVMKEGALLQTGGKLQVKKLLEASGNVELNLTVKKGAALKNSKTETPVTVRMRNASGAKQTLAQNTTVFTVSGSSYATQYRLLDKEGQEQALYRKGNAIKVQGTVATPIGLYYVSDDGQEDLGEYTALADVKKEIARRKDANAVYRIELQEEVFVKGAIPLPAAKTYKELILAGKGIKTTGNLTLTGNVTLYNEVRKVKSAGSDIELPYAVNAAKYTLTIPAGSGTERVGSVKGKAGSCLRIGQGERLNVSGDVQVETLALDGTLGGNGNITITNLISELVAEETGRAEFRLPANKKLTVKGKVEISGQRRFIVNIVDANDALADIQANMVLVTTPYGMVSQFKTENTMPVILREWTLIKTGTQIRASASYEGEGEWSGDYL